MLMQATEMLSPALTVTASVTGIATEDSTVTSPTATAAAVPPTTWQLTVPRAGMDAVILAAT